MKKIVILGSTGSIGRQTLDIVRAFPDEFEVIGLAAGHNITLLRQQIQEFKPKYVYSLTNLDSPMSNVTFFSLSEMARIPEVDLVVVATTGSVGLIPTLEALEEGKSVALSNKEPIVMAGHLIKAYESQYGGQIPNACETSPPARVSGGIDGTCGPGGAQNPLPGKSAQSY